MFVVSASSITTSTVGVPMPPFASAGAAVVAVGPFAELVELADASDAAVELVDGALRVTAVSYTHLTLPTIYSV